MSFLVNNPTEKVLDIRIRWSKKQIEGQLIGNHFRSRDDIRWVWAIRKVYRSIKSGERFYAQPWIQKRKVWKNQQLRRSYRSMKEYESVYTNGTILLFTFSLNTTSVPPRRKWFKFTVERRIRSTADMRIIPWKKVKMFVGDRKELWQEGLKCK